MKKIFLSLLLAGSLLTSCDMDLNPAGSINDKEAIETARDCERYRNGIYNNIRALSVGPYIYYTEIQMDQFLGTIMNGNRIGNLSNGVILSSDTDIESIWGGLYGAIGSINYFLPRAQAVLEKEDLTNEDRININHYLGDAYFARGFFYYWLLDHFCPDYKSENEPYGLCLVTDYDPTADKATYPGRSKLSETYTFIEKDLDTAYTLLKEFEELGTDDNATMLTPYAPYVSSYAVRALQARLALLKKDYATAKKYADEVIQAGTWRLQARLTYAGIWKNDQSTEFIFRPISSSAELGISSTGSAWISTNQYAADYLPSADVVNHLYGDKDCRKDAFIGSRDLLNDGTFVSGAPTFVKYPGNTSLDTDDPRLLNMGKPFRLSEQYLIAAEASYELNLAADANQYLYDLRRVRISGYKQEIFAGTELRDQIRLERNRELIGEGFRMSDLRRWGLGFERNSTYTNIPGIDDILVQAGLNVTYQPNDYRYTWPIPASEMQVNPQLTGQQNPGYRK